MNVFSGLSRPLKAAGLALIVVAVAAAVVGGITVLNSGGSNNNASPGGPSPSQSSSSTATPPSSSSSAPPPSSTTTAPPSSPASPTPGQGQPSQSAGAPSPGEPGVGTEDPAKLVTVRVYNNSLIKGLAARAADDFRAQGWTVAEVSNYPGGKIAATTAYYRPGTDEETAAKALAAAFGMKAEQRFDGIAQSSPGVIVIVTDNYQAGGKSGS
jgi:LytR cell envelope-related transcriptional attenuator